LDGDRDPLRLAPLFLQGGDDYVRDAAPRRFLATLGSEEVQRLPGDDRR
jgi:hypothetical protein